MACSLGPALTAVGYECKGVFSRTVSRAAALAGRLGCPYATQVSLLGEADFVVFSVTDSALPQIIAAVPATWRNALLLHTSGSCSMQVFEGHAAHFGVLYPMQTFTQGKSLSFNSIPLFIEGNTPTATATLKTLASRLSTRVFELDSAQRRRLHLAAVFASNFANHCYALSAELLAEMGLPFDVMLGLTDEVAQKVHHMSPLRAQTGPAVRGDANTLAAHEQLLANRPDLLTIYKLMSASIEKLKNNNSQ